MLHRLGETLQELCIQPAGPTSGGPCPRSGGHCQAEKGKDSQEAEEPGGQQCQPEGLPSPRLHGATHSQGWGKQKEQGPEGGPLDLLVQHPHCTDGKTEAHQEQVACRRSNRPTRQTQLPAVRTLLPWLWDNQASLRPPSRHPCPWALFRLM